MALSAGGKTKKKHQRPHLYEANIRKRLRQMGESYIDTKGRPIDAKTIGPPCPLTCSNECSLNFTENDRVRVFDYYWSLTKDEKKSFFKKYVEQVKIKRKRAKFSTKRSITFCYYFPFHEKRLKVCQVFFCNTLSISANVYYRVFKKKSNETNNDC